MMRSMLTNARRIIGGPFLTASMNASKNVLASFGDAGALDGALQTSYDAWPNVDRLRVLGGNR